MIPALLLIGGCATAPPRPAAPAAAAAAAVAPEPPNPFDDDPASFLVAGGRFPAGEAAIVRVCVSPAGQVDRAELLSSSGDKRFDDYAIGWARQVRLRSLPQGLQTEAVCAPVRVEIHPAPPHEGLPGRQSALG